ncbi:MAG: hypothetical protein ACLQVI_40555 [Polyangiaceae bacterium]
MLKHGKRSGLRTALALIGVLGVVVSASSADASSASAKSASAAVECEWPPLICELFGLK